MIIVKKTELPVYVRAECRDCDWSDESYGVGRSAALAGNIHAKKLGHVVQVVRSLQWRYEPLAGERENL